MPLNPGIFLQENNKKNTARNALVYNIYYYNVLDDLRVAFAKRIETRFVTLMMCISKMDNIHWISTGTKH